MVRASLRVTDTSCMMVVYVRRHADLLNFFSFSTTDRPLEGPWASVEVSKRSKAVPQAETAEDVKFKQERMEASIASLYFNVVKDTDTELRQRMPLGEVMVYAAAVNPAVGSALAPKFHRMAVRAPLQMLMLF